MTQLQSTIEERLATACPDVDVILVEQTSSSRARVFIDHPDGVDLALCERVTRHLGDLLADFGLEVSSPGPKRALTKPQHFRSFVGRRVRVRTRDAVDGHRTFAGELVGASETEVAVAAEAGVVSIPYADIMRSNLVEG